MSDGTLIYAKLITEITKDDERNRIIADDISRMNGSTLVLTDRVAHIQTLLDMLKDRNVKCMGLYALTTTSAKRDRKLAIEKLENGEIDVLVATFALAKEGLDIPSLKNVVLATPQKNETIVTQSTGRVSRKSEGKAFGTVYDYEDSLMMFERWQNRRNGIYTKLGFSIM